MLILASRLPQRSDLLPGEDHLLPLYRHYSPRRYHHPHWVIEVPFEYTNISR